MLSCHHLRGDLGGFGHQRLSVPRANEEIQHSEDGESLQHVHDARAQVYVGLGCRDVWIMSIQENRAGVGIPDLSGDLHLASECLALCPRIDGGSECTSATASYDPAVWLRDERTSVRSRSLYSRGDATRDAKGTASPKRGIHL